MKTKQTFTTVGSIRKMKRPALRTAMTSMIVAGSMAIGGCAFLNDANTPTFNLVEKHIWENGLNKSDAAFPLVMPLALASMATDTFVIHPAMAFDDAARDTRDGLWRGWRWDDQYLAESIALPWRVAATPALYAGSFYAHAFFDVGDVNPTEYGPPEPIDGGNP